MQLLPPHTLNTTPYALKWPLKAVIRLKIALIRLYTPYYCLIQSLIRALDRLIRGLGRLKAEA